MYYRVVIRCCAMAEKDKIDGCVDQMELGAMKSESLPIQVTTVRLTKDDNLRWSAVITMESAGHSHILYINGNKQPVDMGPT